MKVKICGIMSEEAALAASEAGADFLGFVFAESKRKITPESAALIIQRVQQNVKSVGVFVNESYENIIRIAGIAKLDYIQLHGDESPEFCKSLPYPVIKAFSIKEQDDIKQLAKYDCEYFLVDSPGVKYRGGSGIPFDWSLLEHLDIPREKIILAGGLDSENVKKAITTVKPAIVDVSSGVETNGVKDLRKIQEFLATAKIEEREDIGSLHIT
ncbi:phosphoribosylanthranilate isomerase [Lederbergia wuyishanensis]|uniref:N-(5'-phosphoribosyl)anthranilate isomerase n=1 Tax=Lederbergia wuyishanensis TaxID=1347903 RepID=A0ABU0D9Y0_9BACI|nr:phosphoribosylanthranilate isomerase [Lederbergia wuyishanensis]MCJ8008475.1 phosphoribosylanthranilate isomerase [Lederbergia wuyishanensis]MDQ0345218.1 phosphoribosylanthranilate isomerase [Lederbergia wuyishanensis]